MSSDLPGAETEGRQAIVLREGGIAEEGGVFRPDCDRFWLLPTYSDQSTGALRRLVNKWLPAINRDRQSADQVRLMHYVELPSAFRAGRTYQVLSPDPVHVWSETTVQQRFSYQEPGLYVLPVRVFGISTEIEIPNQPQYDGSKSWVDLGDVIAASGTPVLSDRALADVLEEIDRAINSTAVAQSSRKCARRRPSRCPGRPLSRPC
jgi:hypothetical protein